MPPKKKRRELSGLPPSPYSLPHPTDKKGSPIGGDGGKRSEEILLLKSVILTSLTIITKHNECFPPSCFRSPPVSRVLRSSDRKSRIPHPQSIDPYNIRGEVSSWEAYSFLAWVEEGLFPSLSGGSSGRAGRVFFGVEEEVGGESYTYTFDIREVKSRQLMPVTELKAEKKRMQAVEVSVPNETEMLREMQRMEMEKIFRGIEEYELGKSSAAAGRGGGEEGEKVRNLSMEIEFVSQLVHLFLVCFGSLAHLAGSLLLLLLQVQSPPRIRNQQESKQQFNSSPLFSPPSAISHLAPPPSPASPATQTTRRDSVEFGFLTAGSLRLIVSAYKCPNPRKQITQHLQRQRAGTNFPQVSEAID